MSGANKARQKAKFNIDEEEKKVRNNLSRLIHTLQHFPSNRSGLDTNSLWTLVDNLESFNPDRKTRSLHFTQTTEKKTFSKRYLDLKVCPSTESNLRKESHQKFNNHEITGKKYNSTLPSRFSQNKKKTFEKSNLNNTDQLESNHGKEDRIAGNFKKGTYKKGGQGDYYEGNHLSKNNNSREQPSKLENTNKSRSRFNCLRKSDNHNEQARDVKWNNSSLKEIKSYNTSAVRSSSNAKHSCSESSSKPNRSTLKFSTLNKYKPHQCSPKSTKALQNFMFKNKVSQIDRSSMVKKLTDYWNNILNNESDEENDETLSPVGKCKYTKSLEQLIHRCNGSESGESSENNSLSTNSRHMSESNINIMKRVDELNSDYLLDCSQSSKKNSENNTKTNVIDETSVGTKLSPRKKLLMESPSLEVYEDAYYTLENNIPHSEMEEPKFLDPITKCELNTEVATAALQKLLFTLKTIPSCNLWSEEVKLFQPIKKLIYIIINSLKITQNYKDTPFLTILEMYVDQIINEIKDSNPYLHICQSCSSELETFKSAESIISTSETIPTENITDQLQDPFKETVEFKDHIKENETEYMDEVKEYMDKEKDNEDNSESFCSKSSDTLEHQSVGAEISCLTTLEDQVQENKTSCEIKEIQTAVAVPGINLHKVENALKFFMMYKEISWENLFILSSDYYNLVNQNQQLHSFTIVCEEEIILEEDYPHFYTDDKCSMDLKTETNTDQCESPGVLIEYCIDKFIDLLVDNWPDTPQKFLSIVYQATVTVLIWWIIVKEIFLK